MIMFVHYSQLQGCFRWCKMLVQRLRNEVLKMVDNLLVKIKDNARQENADKKVVAKQLSEYISKKQPEGYASVELKSKDSGYKGKAVELAIKALQGKPAEMSLQGETDIVLSTGETVEVKTGAYDVAVNDDPFYGNSDYVLWIPVVSAVGLDDGTFLEQQVAFLLRRQDMIDIITDSRIKLLKNKPIKKNGGIVWRTNGIWNWQTMDFDGKKLHKAMPKLIEKTLDYLAMLEQEKKAGRS